MMTNLTPEYQTPMVCVQQITPEGILCASMTTDNFTMDEKLGLEDF